MHPVYYQPSGNYKPKAPIIIFFLVFALSSFIGLFCGWAFTERILYPEFNIILLFSYLTLIMWISEHITSTVVKKLNFRNPEIAFKIGLTAASLGWIPFYLAIRYIVLREADSSFLEFVYTRIKVGYPVNFLYSSYTQFTVKGAMAVFMWVSELCIVPYLFARILKMQAAMPFSEKTGTWHRRFCSPYRIHLPAKKEVSKKLKQGETNLLLAIQPSPSKYDRKLCAWWGYWGWGNVMLFIPEVDGDDCH